MDREVNIWKAQSKNDPLIFRPFLKVFRSSWILACGLSFTRYTLFWFFFRWFALRFREITYAKNLEFRSGFHWMKPKQKKPFVSLVYITSWKLKSQVISVNIGKHIQKENILGVKGLMIHNVQCIHLFCRWDSSYCKPQSRRTWWWFWNQI